MYKLYSYFSIVQKNQWKQINKKIFETIHTKKQNDNVLSGETIVKKLNHHKKKRAASYSRKTFGHA